VDIDEACDDGNHFSQDGCTAACTIEFGWSCTGAPSACTAGPYAGWAGHIVVDVSGIPNGQEALLLELPSDALVEAGRMRPDCADLRVLDEDLTTLLPHFVEGGCETASLRVWVEHDGAPGAKQLFVVVGHPTAPSQSLTWSGGFLFFTTSACQGDLQLSADSTHVNRFWRSGPVAGVHAGTAFHKHTTATATSSETAVSTRVGDCDGQTVALSETHSHSVSITDPSLGITNLPSHEDLLMCRATTLPSSFGEGTLVFSLSSAPIAGFTPRTDDGRFPRLAFGGGKGDPGGHTHDLTVTVATPNGDIAFGEACIATPRNSTSVHTHPGSIATTDFAAPTPLFVDVASHLVVDGADARPSSSILFVADDIPPLGYDRLTAFDGRLLRMSESPGATGGTATHGHSLSMTMAESTVQQSAATDENGTDFAVAHPHAHTVDATIPDASHMPESVDVLLLERINDLSAKHYSDIP